MMFGAGKIIRAWPLFSSFLFVFAYPTWLSTIFRGNERCPSNISACFTAGCLCVCTSSASIVIRNASIIGMVRFRSFTTLS